MFDPRTLLQKLVDPRPPSEGSGNLLTDLRWSVTEHLSRLLNTIRGDAAIASDYGLPAWSTLMHQFPDALSVMETAIRTTIERYEPRLGRVRVRGAVDAERPMEIRFEVTGRLTVEGAEGPFSFQTSVDSRGRFKV